MTPQAGEAFPAEQAADNERCRLCDADVVPVFRRRVIDRYDVTYFGCTGCGSLQTERPYWLAEAYSDAVTQIDPGAAQRVLNNFVLTRLVAGLLKARRMLDYGGGAGLLCRLLRDVGWDAYSFDRYVRGGYAAGFLAQPSEQFDLVTAYEVLEHLAEPARDIAEIFSGRPRAVLATTYLYSGQGEDWWYLCPEEGQHVFMYSAQAVELIAKRFGYHAVFCNGFFLVVREPLRPLQAGCLRRLSPRLIEIMRPFALTATYRGVQRDLSLLTKRH